jgi:(p)ppGpp synthase/HD superfamily hydrolase
MSVPLTKLSPDFADALAFTALLHTGQVRKMIPGGRAEQPIPYVAHLLAVCALVLENGGSEEEAIAALLHDAIEDQTEHHGGDSQAMRDRIARRFGPRVLELVLACSDSTGVDKAPWRERKEVYIRHLTTAQPSVLLISAADKVHNLRCMVVDLRRHGEAFWTKFNAGREDMKWYYTALLLAYRQGGAKPEMIAEIEHLIHEIWQ